MNKLAVILTGLSLSAWIGISLTQISFTDIAGMGAGSINGRVADLITDEENKEFSFRSKYSSTEDKCKVSDLFDVSVDKTDVDEIRKFWKRIGTRTMDLKVHRVLRGDAYENIQNYIDDMDLTQNEEKKIVSDGDWYQLKSEYVSGTLDYDAVLKDLDSCDYTCDLTDFIRVSDNSKVEAQFKKLQNWKDWKVTYDQGRLELGFDDIKNFITYDEKTKKIRFQLEDLSALTDRIAAVYDTVGKEHSFTSSNGKKIKVNGGTYGWQVDKNKEAEWLRESIKTCNSMTGRKPEFLREARNGTYGSDDIGDTYIEISIKEQHVWIYKKGDVTAESDCVTGTKNKHDTPKGVYYCYEIKPDGKWLTGDTYRTWVNKWVRLTNTGIGLHDATWRRKFGGSIYEKSGSHGCINLPADFADKVMKEVSFGMPVVIY